MPVITTCIEPGCGTLCMGLFCIEHDARPQADFPRGRPWPPVRSTNVAIGIVEPTGATSVVRPDAIPVARS